MNWKREAANELTELLSYKRAIRNMEERIQMLTEQMKATRSPTISDEPGGRSGVRQVDDAWLDAIGERDRLKIKLSAKRKHVALIERGLSALTEEERTVLTLFYIDRPRDHLNVLCEKLGVEIATVYRMKDAALRKYAREEFGGEM